MPGKDKEDKINIVFACFRRFHNIFLYQTLCNAMGRESGSCNAKKECTCSEKYLTPEQFALCAAETSCQLNCKRKGYDQGKVKTIENHTYLLSDRKYLLQSFRIKQY